MKRLAVAAVGFALVVAFATVALSCSVGSDGGPTSTNGGQQEQPVVPPPGIRATIPAEFPEVEEARLRQLVLEPADLPPGFELAFEDAQESEGIIFYVAHYALGFPSEEAGAEAIESHTPLLADVGVFLFDEEALARENFDTFASASPQQWEQSSKTRQHWSAEEMGFEQIDVQARRVPCREFGDSSRAVETSETIRDSVTGEEHTLVDVGIFMRVDRAIGLVGLSAWGEPPPMNEVEALAEKLERRLTTGFR